MLETPTAPAGAAATDTVVKRYAPPNQRNRSLNRRKSSERRYGNDVDKNQTASRSFPTADHGDAGRSSLLNENTHQGLIAVEGCCSGEAFRLLNNRWAAAVRCFNDPSVDLSERPVMYSGNGASAWNHFRLPHQLMTSAVNAGPSGSQMDFLGELQRAMCNSSAYT